MDYSPYLIPALTSLVYRYDYGDGWEVKITWAKSLGWTGRMPKPENML